MSTSHTSPSSTPTTIPAVAEIIYSFTIRLRFKARKVWDRKHNGYRLYIYCNHGTRKYHLYMTCDYNDDAILIAKDILGITRISGRRI